MADIALQSLPSSGQAQSTNITPLTLASRNPTLESNRPAVDGSNSQVRSFLTIQSRNLHRWFKTQFRQSDVFLDSTEKLITEKIADLYQDLSPGWWSQIRKLEYLLSDYSDIKNKPGHDVALDLVQTWLFEDGTDAADIKSHVDAFSVPPTTTFSKLTGSLSAHLSERPSNSSRLIAMAERADPAHDQSFLTFMHKLSATIRLRLRTLSLAPGRVITFPVKQTYDITLDLRFNNVPVPSVQDAQRKQFMLPMKRKPTTALHGGY